MIIAKKNNKMNQIQKTVTCTETKTEQKHLTQITRIVYIPFAYHSQFILCILTILCIVYCTNCEWNLSKETL